MTETGGHRLADEVRAAFTEEAAELIRRVERSLTEASDAEAAPPPVVWLEMLRTLHTLKGAAAAAGEETIKGEVHALEDRVRRLESGSEAFGPQVAEALFRAVEAIGAVAVPVRAAAAERPAPPEAATPPPGGAVSGGPAGGSPPATRQAPADLIRVRPERIDALHALVGELVVTRLQQESLSRRLLALRDRAAEAVGAWRHRASQFTRLRGQLAPAQWGALSANHDAFSGSLTALFQEILGVAREAPLVQAQAAAIGTTLEDGIRELRLMPLQPFFEEYAKVVREATRESGKVARLSIRAEGAEIDRGVLVRLREPLLHLVRNAVVHGIEPPGDRRAAGKPETGTILLEARCEGTRAVIRVADDGAGIDRERVRRKAMQMGLVGEDGAVGDDDLLDVLTRPGFSTRDVADSLAGRGIGLDIVASCVRDLDGRLTLENLPGAGSIFTVDVPVSASTNVGLVVRVGESMFAILLNHVERVIRIGAPDVLRIEGRDTVMVGRDPVAVVPLAGLIGLEGPGVESGKRAAVVLRLGRQRLVLAVDDIPGEEALVVKPLSRAFAGAPLFPGGAVQADGAILPVLDVPVLFERAGTVRSREGGDAPRGEATRPPENLSVLVADDSITMRTLLRNILQGAGYVVAVAHDGQSALGALERLERCDLIISDLQMPRMDGADLCRAVRRSDRPHIPIILVTSVADPEEKRKALEAGADAYVIKGEFEQERFLDLVAKLAGTAARPS